MTEHEPPGEPKTAPLHRAPAQSGAQSGAQDARARPAAEPKTLFMRPVVVASPPAEAAEAASAPASTAPAGGPAAAGRGAAPAEEPPTDPMRSAQVIPQTQIARSQDRPHIASRGGNGVGETTDETGVGPVPPAPAIPQTQIARSQDRPHGEWVGGEPRTLLLVGRRVEEMEALARSAGIDLAARRAAAAGETRIEPRREVREAGRVTEPAVAVEPQREAGPGEDGATERRPRRAALPVLLVIAAVVMAVAGLGVLRRRALHARPAAADVAAEPAGTPVARLPGDGTAQAARASAVPAATATRGLAADGATAAAAGAAAAGLSELEKRAVDRLVANDYVQALAVYRELERRAPGQREYGWMVGLLQRRRAAGCEGGGPCAAR